MTYSNKLQSIALKKEQSLNSLVENQTTYTFNQCELHVFETHQEAHQVGLIFNDFIYTSMLRGKKIMHLQGKSAFDYLPGESVIVGPNELMEIDFPNANKESPTQCLALGISKKMIDNTLDLLNENHAKVLGDESWEIDENVHHIINNQALNQTVNRIINISINEKGRHKDIFVELALKEMILRLMQTQARSLFTDQYRTLESHHPFAHVIHIIHDKIREKISFNKLAQAACMSRATFYKKFKEYFGVTPSHYVLSERLKIAKNLLKNHQTSITQVAIMSGFENLSHFTKTFTKETNLTPSQFKKQYIIY